METRQQKLGRESREARNHCIGTYTWACQFLVKKYGYKMADLGSNAGDGALILSHFAKNLDLYDINEQATNRAKSNDYYCPVKFFQIDLENEYPKDDYDVVTAFEVLEHLENPERLIKEMSKKCQMFIFSVPFDKATHHKPQWEKYEVHKQLFKSTDDVMKMLGDNFKKVKIYYERKGIIQEEPFAWPHRYLGVATQ